MQFHFLSFLKDVCSDVPPNQQGVTESRWVARLFTLSSVVEQTTTTGTWRGTVMSNPLKVDIQAVRPGANYHISQTAQFSPDISFWNGWDERTDRNEMETQTDKYPVMDSMPRYAREGKMPLEESFDSTTICAKFLVTGQVKERHRQRERHSVVTRERDIVTDQGWALEGDICLPVWSNVILSLIHHEDSERA